MKFNTGYIDELGHAGAVRSVVVAKANQIAATARANAPVDTGDYRDSIHVEVDSSTHRVVAHVVASSDHALLVESKTGNLARALRGATGG